MLFRSVTLKELKKVELPEADDEFAQDVSEFDTLEEYKNDIRTKLTEQKETEAKNALEDKAVAAVVEGAKMDIPQRHHHAVKGSALAQLNLKAHHEVQTKKQIPSSLHCQRFSERNPKLFKGSRLKEPN